LKKHPKQKRSKEVVEAVLDAAARILSKIRLKDATTNKIANTAGVGIGSLYDYFPNKSSIAVALMDKRIEKIVVDFEALLEAPHRSLESLINDSIEFIAEDFFGRRQFLREIFLLAPEHGRMEALYKARIKAAKLLETYLVSKHQKDPDWASWKSFFLMHSLIGFLESYVIIEEANFEIELMKSEMRNLMRLALEI
jgi:AcrR family transcriptional regulator